LELARDAFKESERRQAAQYLEAYARSGLTLRIGEAVQGKDPDADLVALRNIFKTAGVYSLADGPMLDLETIRTDAQGNEIPLLADPCDSLNPAAAEAAANEPLPWDEQDTGTDTDIDTDADDAALEPANNPDAAFPDLAPARPGGHWELQPIRG